MGTTTTDRTAAKEEPFSTVKFSIIVLLGNGTMTVSGIQSHTQLFNHPVKINSFFSFFFFFFFVIVYTDAGVRTPELKVTKETGYHLGQRARSRVENMNTK